MVTAASPKRSYGRQLALLVHEYMDAHGTDAIDLHEVAAWAVRTGKYERHPPSLVQLCARELSRAMRNEYVTDPQGRAVRRMHPARYPSPSGRQMVIWADLFKAEPKHIRVSMQQRRQAILADARQHKVDVESYNDNNVHGAQLEMFDYNFNLDLEEMALPTTYPNERPASPEE